MRYFIFSGGLVVAAVLPGCGAEQQVVQNAADKYNEAVAVRP